MTTSGRDQQSPFEDVLQRGEDQLWVDFKRTKTVKHSGLKGSGRERAVGVFLIRQLPERFGVASGEAFDTNRSRSNQLDIVIYDRMAIKPLKIDDSNFLFPAEALLAVVEVKSRLTRAELKKSLTGARSVSRLQVGGGRFVMGRAGGIDASDHNPRCLFTVFAFSSDLRAQEWPSNEWSRLRAVCTELAVEPAIVSRLVVLDRGLLLPPDFLARNPSGNQDSKGVLGQWFLHVTNFLSREASRRRAPEWRLYATSQLQEIRLDGYQGDLRTLRREPAETEPEREARTPVPRDRVRQPRGNARRRPWAR